MLNCNGQTVCFSISWLEGVDCGYFLLCVIQLEEVQQVVVKGNSTELRDLVVSRDATKVRVTLWHPAGQTELCVGQDVKLKDATVNYNSFYNENTLSLGNIEDIEASC